MPFYHVTPLANRADIEKSGLLPAIGPRSLAAGETRPSIYLFTDRVAADDAIANWLGTEIDEPMVIYEIDEADVVVTPKAPWEATLTRKIPPHRLKVFAILD